jgi:predicted enzyme related to lactoylglutathione lyase
MSGELNHFELQVADIDKARNFFVALFGWELERRMDGAFYLISGRPSGGLVASPHVRTPPRLYFAVDDLDQAVGQVRALRGETEGVRSALGYGSWAQCRDDQGTEFGLYVRGFAQQ